MLIVVLKKVRFVDLTNEHSKTGFFELIFNILI